MSAQGGLTDNEVVTLTDRKYASPVVVARQALPSRDPGTPSTSSLSAEVYNSALLQKQDEIIKLGSEMTEATTQGRYRKAGALRKRLKTAREEYDKMIEKRVEHLAAVKQEQLTESWQAMRERFETRFMEERHRIDQLITATKDRLVAQHERELTELEEAYANEVEAPPHTWSSSLRNLMKTEQRLAMIGDFDGAEQCRVQAESLRQREFEDCVRKRQHQFAVNKRLLAKRHMADIEAVARRGERMVELARRNYNTSVKALDAKSNFIAKKVTQECQKFSTSVKKPSGHETTQKGAFGYGGAKFGPPPRRLGVYTDNSPTK
ncbi:hypothetical protein FOL47_009817 [Perkinsus chesapeaki]|uniref:Uncharacterized protein n=1 Tax=Perkinsus chesapeaki TaxID=330153 RepID=A0A7J6MRK3_PERCH|nr:hypothetical protein FOL47_009817 [Perkinsus chesapeaki]